MTSALDDVLDGAAHEFKAVFGDRPLELQVCSYVLQTLRDFHDQNVVLTLGVVAEHFGWSEAQTQGAIVTALDFLSYSVRPPVLDRRFELWADQQQEADILEDPECELDDRTVCEALVRGYLQHPETGDRIDAFEERVTVAYVPHRNEANSESGSCA